MSEKKNWRQRLRVWLFWRVNNYDDWVYKTDKPDWMYVPHWPETFFCTILFAHQPEGDQCGMPAHDFCLWCGKSMPNQAKRVVR
jgi:hypothetical protein